MPQSGLTEGSNVPSLQETPGFDRQRVRRQLSKAAEQFAAAQQQALRLEEQIVDARLTIDLAQRSLARRTNWLRDARITDS